MTRVSSSVGLMVGLLGAAVALATYAGVEWLLEKVLR